MLVRLAVALGVSAVSLASPSPSVAQVPSLAPERRSADPLDRPELPGFEDEQPVLPALPDLPPVPDRPSSGLAVFVERIVVEGNTVFSDRDLAPITSDYEGRSITTEKLLELRDRLTRFYIEQGYINSGAVIPDQEVDAGTIRIQIVEGTLDEVVLGDLDILRPGYIRNRIARGAGTPLNVNALQDELQLLLADPSIARLDARLGPGEERGGSRLEVDVEEAERFAVDLGFDNNRAASVGELQASLDLTARNVLGFSDPAFARIGVTKGLKNLALGYSVPLTADDLRLRLFGEVSDSLVIEDTFRALDIESETKTAEIGLSYPLIRSLDQELTVGADFVRRRSETELLDRPFSFSPGVVDGKSDVTVLRLPTEYRARSRERVLVLRSTFSLGLDLLGATENGGDTPDGQFFHWLGQGQYAQRIGDEGAQVIVRTDLQASADELLPLEQIALGGAETVRGYRENLLVRDNGVIGSIEGRIPVFELPVDGISDAPGDGAVLLAPFFDAGYAWDTGQGPGRRPGETITSVGMGVIWNPSSRIATRLTYGYGFDDDIPDSDDASLQQFGLHFEVRFGLY